MFWIGLFIVICILVFIDYKTEERRKQRLAREEQDRRIKCHLNNQKF